MRDQSLTVPGQVGTRRTDGPRATVRHGSSTMVLTGLTSELLLYVAGRRDHAEVLVAAP